jgi:hypothetical protein
MKLNLRSIVAALLALAAAAPGLFPGFSKRQREVSMIDTTVDTMVEEMILGSQDPGPAATTEG